MKHMVTVSSQAKQQDFVGISYDYTVEANAIGFPGPVYDEKKPSSSVSYHGYRGCI